MSHIRPSSARSAVVGWQAGRAGTNTQPCSCGGRESQHQLIRVLIQMCVRCRRTWRRSEYLQSFGFMAASVNAVTDSTIRDFACDAPRLMACGGRQRLSRPRHPLAMLVATGSSVRSVPMSGGGLSVAVSTCVQAVADLRDCRMQTKMANKITGAKACARQLPMRTHRAARSAQFCRWAK